MMMRVAAATLAFLALAVTVLLFQGSSRRSEGLASPAEAAPRELEERALSHTETTPPREDADPARVEAPRDTRRRRPSPAKRELNATLKVRLVGRFSDRPLSRREVRVESKGGEHWEGETDLEGQVQLEVPSGIELWVAAEDQGRRVGPLSRGGSRTLVFRFAAGEDQPTLMYGRVVDARTDRPLGDAVIRRMLPAVRSGEIVYVTDRSGRFEVPMGRRQESRLSVICPGRAPVVTVLTPAHQDPEHPLEVRLQPGGALRGTIKGADTSHVLRLSQWAPNPVQVGSGHSGSFGGLSYDTDVGADGSFAIDSLPVGTSLMAQVMRGEVRECVFSEEIYLREGEEREVAWVLLGHGKVEGRVVDSNGQGLSGIELVIRPWGRKFSLLSYSDDLLARTCSDSRGRFLFEEMVAGKWIVEQVDPERERRRSPRNSTRIGGQSVVEQPYAFAYWKSRGSSTWIGRRGVVEEPSAPALAYCGKPEFVAVKSGETVQVELRLEPSLYIRGTVFDSNVEPAKGVFVRASGQHVEKSARSNGEGRFELGPLPSGEYVLHTIVSQGREAPAMEHTALAGTDGNVLYLREGGSLEGNIVEGQEASNAWCELLLLPRSGGTMTQNQVHNGVFEVEALLPGMYDLFLSHQDGRAAGQRLEIHAGKTTEVEVELVPGARLTVRNQTSNPGLRVFATQGGVTIGKARLAVGQDATWTMLPGSVDLDMKAWNDEGKKVFQRTRRVSLAAGGHETLDVE